MDSAAFWAVLKQRYGIEPFAKGQHGSRLCACPNQTHYQIPDPDVMPDDDVRAEVLNFVLEDLAGFVLPY